MIKKISKLVISSVIIILMAAGWYGCREDYLIDGGTTSPYFDGSVMEYLESRPDLFSDLVKVIKQTKWEAVLSDEKEDITFFAPTDFAIENGVKVMNHYLYYGGQEKVTDLNQVKPEVWEDLIGMYVMKGKYRLNDIAQIDTIALSTYPGQTNYTYDKSYKMTMGVCYGDANGIKYAGYRQVMYAYPETGYPYYSYVSSCNIEPRNGIVHVLRIDHFMGFVVDMLYSKAFEAGIIYPDKKTEDGKTSFIRRKDQAIEEEKFEN